MHGLLHLHGHFETQSVDSVPPLRLMHVALHVSQHDNLGIGVAGWTAA